MYLIRHSMRKRWKWFGSMRLHLIMIGVFHLLMTLLAIIGSLLGDACLRDIAVQSEVVSEGSIDSVLSGKHYNRAVRLHKIMYEAIVQLLVHDFESSLCENDLEMQNEQKTQLEQLKLNLCQEEMEKILKSDLLPIAAMGESFPVTRCWHKAELAKFWLTYC